MSARRRCDHKRGEVSDSAYYYLEASRWYKSNWLKVPVAVSIAVEGELRDRAGLLIAEGVHMWRWKLFARGDGES